MGELRTAANTVIAAGALAKATDLFFEQAPSNTTPADRRRHYILLQVSRTSTRWSRDVAKLLTSTRISNRLYNTYGDMRVLDTNQEQRDRCYQMICDGVKYGFISHDEAMARIDVLNTSDMVQFLSALALLVKDLPWFHADPTFGRFM